MFFNPLFLQVINNQESLSPAKTQKLNGSSYLFSDIIKVCIDKAEGENAGMGNELVNNPLNILPSDQSALDSFLLGKPGEGVDSAEATLLKLLQQIFPQKFVGVKDEPNISGISGKTNIVNNTLQLNENEVTALISGLINNNYQGKLSVISDKNTDLKSNLKSAHIVKNNILSPEALLDLLKEGVGISLESPSEDNKQGLLISLVDIVTSKIFPEKNSGETSDVIGSDVNNVSENEIQSQPDLNSASANPEHLYQVELTLITGAGNLNLQNAITNFAGPNTAELQELVNSKNVKLQEGLAGESNKQPGTSAAPSEGVQLNSLSDQAVSAGADDINNIPVISVEKSQGSIPDVKIPENVKNSQYGELFVNTNNPGTKIISAEINPLLAGKTKGESSGSELTDKINGSINKINKPEVKSNITLPDVGINNGIKAADLETIAADSDELKPVQSKKSKIIKDIDLSIKAAKFHKLDSGPVAEKAEQQPEIRLNQTDASGIDLSANENTQNNKSDTLKETGIKLKENSLFNQAADINSAKENNAHNPEIKDVKLSGSAVAENMEKGSTTENNGGKADKDPQSNTQEHQVSSQDKTVDFKSKLQDNQSQSQGNDFVGKVEPSDRGRTFIEPNNLNTPSKTVKAADIMKEISRFIQQNSEHTLTLKIEPESLGTVKIALDVVNKLVHANIEVDNEAARKMVETNLNQLYNSLNQSGIQLSSLNISMANYDHKQGKGFVPKRKNSHFNEEVNYDDKSIGESKKLGYNTYEYLV